MDSVLTGTLKANLKNAATEDAMLDTVNRKTYRNAGTGAFAYGNDVNN